MEVVQPVPKLFKMAVYFLGGSLPASASLDIQIFSLFARIARLGPENLMFKVAFFALENSYLGSYFSMLRKLSKKYCLPDPMAVLANPPPKTPWKKLVKTNKRIGPDKRTDGKS